LYRRFLLILRHAGFHWADFGAFGAIAANFGVDSIFGVGCRNCFFGAGDQAGVAHDTFIVDNVSHLLSSKSYFKFSCQLEYH
jgi:hypothetical protein